jgi:hypothetical protein
LTLKQKNAKLKTLKKIRHILQRIAVVALVAGLVYTATQQVAFHSDNEIGGHRDAGGAHAECVCICACHTAFDFTFDQGLCTLDPILYVTSEYIILLGTHVPADIFRPPLANS